MLRRSTLLGATGTALAAALAAGCPAGDAPPRPPVAAPEGGGQEVLPPPVVLDPLPRVIAQARGDGRGTFVPPAPEEQAALAGLVEEIARAAASRGAPGESALEGAGDWNARARALGFEVALVREHETFIVLRELEGVHRGGGVYAFRPGASGRPIVVQAPHSFFDEGTGDLAVDLFVRTGAAAIAMNTIHRYLGKTKPPQGVSPADVANAEQSYFQGFTVGTSRAHEKAIYVQVHGFSSEAHPELAGFDLVASKGDAAAVADPTFEALVDELRCVLGPPRVAVYGRETRSLGATKNVQGRFINGTSDDFFYHLEMSRPLRVRLESDASLRARLAEAIRRAAEAPR
jgi:hypothetical protein